jgi:uncharacterized protein YbaP (TraB family)
MKRRALLAALLGLAAPPAVTGTHHFSRGLLWRVGRSGAGESYAFGTLHADDPRLQVLPQPVQQAFAASRVLMLEHVADRYASERFLEAAMYQDRRTLLAEIGEQDFEQVVQALQPIGLSRDFILKIKPWGVLLNLRTSRQPAGAASPDAQLHALARGRRMPVEQIENVEEMVFTFDEMPPASQVALLRHFLRHREALDVLAERTLRHYLLGDLEGLWHAQRDHALQYPEIAAHHAELMKRVVLDRSVVMAFRAQRELRRGRAFVAVGALHLYGPRGMLALLEADGYPVTRLY